MYKVVAVSKETHKVVDSYKGDEAKCEEWIKTTRKKYEFHPVEFNSLKIE